MVDDRWLVVLDIDGTVLKEDGEIAPAVVSAVRRVRDAGHEVMLATGRSAALAMPVLDRLGLTPDYLVTSNGAVTLKRDSGAPMGYVREFVETFDPRNVLSTIRESLEGAHYAVEDQDGVYQFTGEFPDGTLGAASERVHFDQLLSVRATRVVVISPAHPVEQFLAIVERMGLHRVSYNVGWTAWLDIAPDGVNKATALEKVRDLMGIPRERILAIGDGRNDIDMLRWAGSRGRSFAMGQAPDVVKEAAQNVTATDFEDGVARVLDTF
ncbi:MAG: HAD family phosphatase [Salinibacterium sp.]|nr:MAG: HAD family phosphatase [Salinibacterium sp.]